MTSRTDSLFSKSRAAFGLAMAVACSIPEARAEDTIGRIKSTQSVTIGARESSGALSYLVGGTGEYTGFQVDICKRIVSDLRTKLALPKLDVRFVGVTAQNRIPLLVNGTIDIECGSTANTLARQREVAFSYTTYVEETRVAVKTSSGIDAVEKLAGKKVVSTTGTTSVQTLRRNSRVKDLGMDTVFGKDHSDSFLLLDSDRADAFVMDRQVLAGLIANSRKPDDYRILGESLSLEPVAIMIRKDDPAFKNVVDETIAAQFSSGDIRKLYDKWFRQPIPPANVSLNLELSPATAEAWAKPNARATEDLVPK
jgi:glutamate/aspartate transport system substrate-binding protein